jgi:F-type H+-transporting ATPase subunit b
MTFDATFWVGASFLVVIAFLAKNFSSVITAALDKRAKHIEETLAEAAALKKEAENLRAEYITKHTQIESEARALMKNAEESAAKRIDEAEKAFTEMVSQRVEAAKRRLDDYETAAAKKIQEKLLADVIAAAEETLRAKHPEWSENLTKSALSQIQEKI